MMQGYIKLSRCILQNCVFDNPELLKVWVWCLLKASHKKHKQTVGSQVVELEKGQFIFGRKRAAIELQMSESKVYRLMKILEKTEKTNSKPNNKFSVVTVINWELYQGKAEEDEQQGEQQMNNKRTTNEQQMNTNKNGNNAKNGNNEKKESQQNEFADDSPSMILSLRLFALMEKNNPKVKKPNLQKWCIDMDKILRIDGYSFEETANVIDFSQNSDFWKANILSPGKLREKMGTLILQKGGYGSARGVPQEHIPKYGTIL